MAVLVSPGILLYGLPPLILAGLKTANTQLKQNNRNVTTMLLNLQLGLPPPRYYTVYVDMNQTSYDHAQSICEKFGSGIATVLDQLDFETLNTTLKGINAQTNCGKRMFLGAKSPGSSVWSWRTGESIPNDWEHWGPNEPNSNKEVCMRMILGSDNWMEIRDQTCNTGVLITDFKCIICDVLP